MQEIIMLDTIERYIRGEMLPEERVFFEQLRKNNPAVDQMVVEHTVFLSQMNKYGERKEFKAQLQDIHNKLFETGAIREKEPTKIIRLWKKSKRTIAVAASIAGITAIAISGLISYFSPKVNTQVTQLSRILENQERTIKDLSKKINEAKAATPKIPVNTAVKTGGTGFLIDPKGYLITNAHVVDHAKGVIVQSNNGEEYNARVVSILAGTDLAIIKIDDEDYKSAGVLPYSISHNNADLGEPIFTLGYPRDEIVYGEGYMSAKTGFEGDTLACQIAVAANPGNSGGPVLNKNGEVIGVLSTRQLQAQGVVFAIRSKNIFRAVEELKKDSTYAAVRLPSTSSLRGVDRTQQIKKIAGCVFVVKSY